MAVITPLGGVREIGGSKILVEFDKSRILLDFGISYKQKAMFYEEYLAPRSQVQLHDFLELGLLPRLDGLYRQDALCPSESLHALGQSRPLWECDIQSYEEYAKKQGRPFVDALLITHGHDDHYSMMAFLGGVPTYCSEETKILMDAASEVGIYQGYEGEFTCLIKRKLGQLSGGYFPGEPKIIKGDESKRPIHTFTGRIRFPLDNAEVEVEAIPVGHSVPGAVAYIIHNNGKVIVYTGDLRFHGRYGVDLRKELTDLKPDVLLIEGTRIDDDVQDDEERVGLDLAEEIENTKGLVMVGFRWKDVERFETVKEATENAGRELVLFPRLAFLLNRLGYDVEAMPHVHVFLERRSSMLYSKADYVRDHYKVGYSTNWKEEGPDLTHLEGGLTALDIRKEPQRYVLQLDYWRFNNLIDIKPPPHSKYIRASTEPFTEELELSEERLKSWLKHFRINPPRYEPIQIHASGHASGPELLELARVMRPKMIIPIHTEHPEIFQEELGDKKVILPEQGKPIELIG